MTATTASTTSTPLTPVPADDDQPLEHIHDEEYEGGVKENNADEAGELARDLKRRLDDAQDAIATLERRAKVQRLLRDADTIDAEAATLLTEAAIASMDEPDVELAVRDLRRHRPYLFRRRSTPGSPATSPRLRGDAPSPRLEAATTATLTGHRRDLLRYLRLRRDGR